ncbi:PREDICTED: uncharacterized protein LOC107073423 [Polistes dominula]|uniref:Uncharacterized protein LOC107073423 n=1 Tax=Polistes dominula TaxID=743375 RepID=A0ABM1JAR2_POLDO|nr:PREDICTED: uncharacterized protein LOC107073423 [Polistes dominula]
MKRRKYDDKVYSTRHIRRLAKKQTDEDLRNIAAAIETSVSLPSHVTSEPQTSSTDKTIECKQSSTNTIKQDPTLDEMTKDKSSVKMHAVCKVPFSDTSTEIEVNYHAVQYSIDVKDTEINAINEECDDHPMNTSEKINDNIDCSLSCSESDDLSSKSCDDEIENLNHDQKFVNTNDCEGNIKTEEKILKYLQVIKEAQKILLQRLNKIDGSVSNLQRRIKNFKSNRIQ